jgi:hypothetical protein
VVSFSDSNHKESTHIYSHHRQQPIIPLSVVEFASIYYSMSYVISPDRIRRCGVVKLPTEACTARGKRSVQVAAGGARTTSFSGALAASSHFDSLTNIDVRLIVLIQILWKAALGDPAFAVLLIAVALSLPVHFPTNLESFHAYYQLCLREEEETMGQEIIRGRMPQKATEF